MIGNAYISGGMSLLVVDKIRDTYIISLQKYKDGFYILFPPIFPGNPESLNGDEDIVHYCSEPIGKMFDRRNN